MTYSEKAPLLGDSDGRSSISEKPVSTATSAGETSTESSSNDTKPSSWTRQQMLVATALSLQNISFAISFSVISPFYPTEAAKKGASKTVVGMVFGIFQLVIFVTSPIYGNFIDKIGPKFMFIAGSFILGGCSICFGFLDGCPDGTVYIVMCFVCRSIEANGSAMLSTASFAIMAKTFPNDIGKALGILETFSGIGMILGPSVGGGLYELGGFKLPFIVMGTIIWITTVVSYFVLPKIEDMSSIDGSFLKLLRIPGCIIIYLVIAACAVALSFLDPTFSPFMQKEFSFLTIGQIGLIFMIAPGVYAFSAPFSGIISDMGFQGSLAVVGLVINSIAFLLLGPSPLLSWLFPTTTLPETIVGLVVMGLTIGWSLIPVFPLVIQLAKSHGFDDSIQTLGIVSGFFNSSFSIGGFLGPTAAGFFSEKFGFAWSSTICGFIILFVGLLLAGYILIMKFCYEWPIPVQEAESSDAAVTDSINSSQHAYA